MVPLLDGGHCYVLTESYEQLDVDHYAQGFRGPPDAEEDPKEVVAEDSEEDPEEDSRGYDDYVPREYTPEPVDPEDFDPWDEPASD
ncbi:hypothetical protein FNV43_RR27137 [Rhamnella rubrinervis]|uniref:Uncharacterized protein n=1 Tax=Rhamnella rubrinervis TaxID=2594499 RepID=A0A8K0DWB9_9ROSA|nr:hypothetical protein FNV43_RR27137 [Rhamnella rubrinervis]